VKPKINSTLVKLLKMDQKTSFEKLRDFDSRLPAMVSDLLARRERSGGRVEKSSFRRIPSIKSFKVEVGE